jgi:hypothetical protein
MAKELSQWWFGRSDLLWRRPGNEVRSNRPQLHTGDIIPDRDAGVEVNWPFHVELKSWSRKAMKLDLMFWPSRSPIKKIWDKVLKTRRRGLVPMLLLKANNIPTICVMRRSDLTSLVLPRIHKSTDANIASVLSVYARFSDLEDNYVVLAFPWSDIYKHEK